MPSRALQKHITFSSISAGCLAEQLQGVSLNGQIIRIMLCRVVSCLSNSPAVFDRPHLGKRACQRWCPASPLEQPRNVIMIMSYHAIPPLVVSPGGTRLLGACMVSPGGTRLLGGGPRNHRRPCTSAGERTGGRRCSQTHARRTWGCPGRGEGHGTARPTGITTFP